MSLIQSFWSKPAIEGRWGISEQLEANIWIAALSCVYAYKNNIPLIMHTDDFGKELLQHLPYTEIRLTLNQIPKDTPTGQWAVSKMYALQNSELGDIHIDNDVFIKKRSLYDVMSSRHYDVIVLSLEDTKGPLYVQALEVLNQYSDVVDSDYFSDFAYNCGVLGFKNKELKDRFIGDYFKFYEHIKLSPELLEWLHSEKQLTFELLIELLHLFSLSSNHLVTAVLMHKLDAVGLGYQHLIGRSKYAHLLKVKEVLLKLSPEIYYKTKEILENYGSKNREA